MRLIPLRERVERSRVYGSQHEWQQRRVWSTIKHINRWVILMFSDGDTMLEWHSMIERDCLSIINTDWFVGTLHLRSMNDRKVLFNKIFKTITSKATSKSAVERDWRKTSAFWVYFICLRFLNQNWLSFLLPNYFEKPHWDYVTPLHLVQRTFLKMWC